MPAYFKNLDIPKQMHTLRPALFYIHFKFNVHIQIYSICDKDVHAILGSLPLWLHIALRSSSKQTISILNVYSFRILLKKNVKMAH